MFCYMTDILGVITARGNSRGLPGKNIRQLGDRPLLAWSILAAQRSQRLTRCIVSTDDQEIAEVARQWGGEVPFLRPKELAEDDTPHLPVMQHALREMEARDGVTYECAVILQPTSPFRLPQDIDETITLLERTDADSAVTLYELDGKEHPMKVKKLEGERVVPYVLDEPEGARRQDLPKAYKRSSHVYAIRRKTLMDDERLFGDYIAGHVVDRARVVDIDDELDWLKTQYIFDTLGWADQAR